MNWNHQAYRVGIFGGSGTGKTTFALGLITRANYRARFIFDPEGEFAARLKSYPARNPVQMTEQLASGWCIFDPSDMFPDDSEAAVAFFAAFAFEVSCKLRGKKLFVVDELQMYVTGHAIPRPLMKLVQTGRRRELDSLFIGQAPNLLHNSIRAQLTEAVCFRLTDPRAHEWPLSVGMNPEELAHLPDFAYVARNLRTGKETRGGPKVTQKDPRAPMAGKTGSRLGSGR